MPANLVQYRGTVGVFNNRKFTRKLQYKGISTLKFIQTCLIADYLYLYSHSIVSFFMLLIVFFLLKPKVPKGVKSLNPLDFNAKSKFCYCNDNTSSQGKTLENLTLQFRLHHVIKEPTHILYNSSSCIDLIFASKFTYLYIQTAVTS